MSDESDGSQPRKNEEHAISEKGNPPKENATNPPRGNPAGIQNPPNHQPAVRNPEQAKNKKKHDIKWWKDRLEIVAIFGELIGIAVGIFVLIVLIGQYREMVEATNITGGQLDAMKSQSDVMRGQLDEMQNATDLDQRAWIFPQLINGLVWQSNSFITTLILKNTGKTPATKIGTWENSTTNVDDTKLPDPQIEGLKFALIPNSEREMTNSIPEAISKQMVINGKTAYLYGIVYYDDIFDKTHWTQFCYSMNGSWVNGVWVTVMTQTFFHNSSGDEQTNKTNQNFIRP